MRLDRIANQFEGFREGQREHRIDEDRDRTRINQEMEKNLVKFCVAAKVTFHSKFLKSLEN